MHTEKVNGLIQFLVIHDRVIAAVEKICLEDKSKESKGLRSQTDR